MRWLSSSLRSSSVSDPKRPHAKAALAKDGTFAFIGDAAAARKLVCEGTKVLDYGDNFIYPGFLESHCHGYFAGRPRHRAGGPLGGRSNRLRQVS